MKTTIIGQLCLLMLVEKLFLNGFEIISANTDGVVVKFKKSKEKEKLYYDICKQWEIETKLDLEETQYDLLVMSNVNNYIAIKKGDAPLEKRVKLKGWFEIDKQPHKNHSMKVVPLALYNYYIHNIDYREFILNHENIHDFSKAVKAKSDSYFELYDIVNKKDSVQKLDKVVRYYVSIDGKKLIKKLKAIKESVYENTLFDGVFSEERSIEVESRYLITYCNNIKNASLNNVNYDYYIKESEKIINRIKQ